MDFSFVLSGMSQQINMLKKLDSVINYCEKNGLVDAITPEEMQQLKKYVSDMQCACNTATKLASSIKKVEDAKKAEKDKKIEAPKETKVKPSKKADVVEPIEDEFDFLS